MNKNAYSLIALLFASMAVFTSCGPDPDPDPAPDDNDAIGNSGWVISEIFSDSEDGSDIYYYDNKGRVVRMEISDNSTETLTYSENGITLFDGNGRPQMYWDVINGLVQNCFEGDDFSENYQYNSKRQLVGIYISEENGRYTYEKELTWNGNDLTSFTSREKMPNGAYGQTGNATIKYADATGMNPACIKPLNRYAMTMIFGIYPAITLSGYCGEVPESLIAGCNAISEGQPQTITYGNFDENGCPRKMIITSLGIGRNILSLKWKKI